MLRVFAISSVPQWIIWFDIQHQLVAVPGGDRDMRLHHRMAKAERGLSGVELDQCGRERTGEIADSGLGWTVGTGGRLGGVLGHHQVVGALRWGLVDADQRGGSVGRFEGHGHDEAIS
jgi:hypothetical protein